VRHRNLPFPKQKLRLYTDENFPLEVVQAIRSDSAWRRKLTVQTAADAGNLRRDDRFHFEYCRKNGLVLVTLDNDFMDDRAFPFGDEEPGLIRIVSRSSDQILAALEAILIFVTEMPFPSDFIADSKLQVSNEVAVMRGRDVETRQIKTLHLIPGKTSAEDVMTYFSLLPHAK
jgi:predicted nuclease of predicted toxin-antitoxin system